MTQWHSYLITQQVEIADRRVLHFGDPQQELQATASATILADLSHLGLLHVEGEDRVTFLQGQLTNDIRLLDGSRSQYTGYCTAKGRLLALFLAFADKERICLQLNGALLEPAMKRLQMYVLRAKVTLRDASSDIVRLGLAGDVAERLLTEQFGQAPRSVHEQLTLPDAVIIRLPGQRPRYEIFVPVDKAPALWESLRRTAQPVGAPCWDWLEVEAGIPDIGPATQEAFVPQMVNLDVLGGISFKKGCYTGQEIVARTHYLGKVKRRTLPLHIPAGLEAQAGDPLYAGENDSEAVGMLVRVAPSPHGGLDALAELRLEAMRPEAIRLSPSGGACLRLGTLPYALPE